MPSPHHQSTHSSSSTYPLPSLCSSISSNNSSSKSLPLPSKSNNIICGQSAEDVSALVSTVSRPPNSQSSNSEQKQKQQQQRKRWDESQFAIELCDDSYKSVCSHNNSNHSRSSSSSTTQGLKDKLKNSKLFHQSQISGKLSSLLRKIKSL